MSCLSISLSLSLSLCWSVHGLNGEWFARTHQERMFVPKYVLLWKQWSDNWFDGPGRFKKLRETCRKNPASKGPETDFMVTSYALNTWFCKKIWSSCAIFLSYLLMVRVWHLWDPKMDSTWKNRPRSCLPISGIEDLARVLRLHSFKQISDFL